jgi:hypothetical protein
MKTPHGIDTPQNAAKSVGAVIAFIFLIGLGVLLISNHNANLILGYAIIIGFLALIAYAFIAAAIESRRSK